MSKNGGFPFCGPTPFTLQLNELRMEKKQTCLMMLDVCIVYTFIFFYGMKLPSLSMKHHETGKDHRILFFVPLYCSQNSLSGRQIDETQYAYVHRRMYI